MDRNKEYFSHLKDKDMQFQIELRDDGKYATKGVGTISFESDLGNSLNFRDVLYVPSLKKNLVLVDTLENKGYDVSLAEVRVTSSTQLPEVRSREV